MTTLAELRQASLKEQKQKELSSRPAETPPDSSSPEAAPTPPPAPAVPVNGAAPVTNGNGHHAPVTPPVSVPLKAPEPIAPLPVSSPEAIKAEKFFTQIHEMLSHKTLHPSGAKVSADMPPALFHRAKRYCLDHGNITLRQVLIDLLTTYLEEEGY